MLESNLFIISIIVIFVLFLAYTSWLRYKLHVSKARFALSALVALSSWSVASLATLISPTYLEIANFALNYFGYSAAQGENDIVKASVTILGFTFASAVLFVLYRIAHTCIIHWDGPTTITVNNLAKENKDTHIFSLAASEFARLLSGQRDQLASDAAINWKHQLAVPPERPQWHQLARSYFVSAIPEARIQEDGWRARSDLWVGEIFDSARASLDASPLYLLVSLNKPSTEELENRLKTVADDARMLEKSRVCVIYKSSNIIDVETKTVLACDVEIYTSAGLLQKGLGLNEYARNLIIRFEKDKVAGTSATLKNTTVPPHVTNTEGGERELFEQIVKDWMKEDSRTHLVVTGEYGEGKSTAMLRLCVDWARRFVKGEAKSERVPLLIELRGKNPAEVDPRTFISTWATQNQISPDHLYNLIQSGGALIILEGFDELLHAGRAYDRHSHFNALWKLAYPGTKMIFSGRPNFFLDDEEANRTLRNDTVRTIVGSVSTRIYRLSRLTRPEVETVIRGFNTSNTDAIMKSADANGEFMEIVSRPSMIPVVVSIWDQISGLKKDSNTTTSALMLQYYMSASLLRKEQELEQDKRKEQVPDDASYLLLPTQVRELFMLLIVSQMVRRGLSNTIARSDFDDIIGKSYEAVFNAVQTVQSPPDIVKRIRNFEERFSEEPRHERLERICNEVATAGWFVSDPAGGPSNLRLPHKQYFEYLIAKYAWILFNHDESVSANAFAESFGLLDPSGDLLDEPQSLKFFAEVLHDKFEVFDDWKMRILLGYSLAISRAMEIGNRFNFASFLSFDRNLRPIGERRTRLVKPTVGGDATIDASRRKVFGREAVRYFNGMLFIGCALASWNIYSGLWGGLMSLVLLCAAIGVFASKVDQRPRGASFAFARLTVLQRIVEDRMVEAGKWTEQERLSLEMLLREMLNVVTKSESSQLLEYLEFEKGNRRLSKETELQKLIRPVV